MFLGILDQIQEHELLLFFILNQSFIAYFTYSAGKIILYKLPLLPNIQLIKE